jgi:hypothetical protein
MCLIDILHHLSMDLGNELEFTNHQLDEEFD